MSEHANNGTGAESNGTRTGLQADRCTGAWLGNVTTLTDDNALSSCAPVRVEAADTRMSNGRPRMITQRRQAEPFDKDAHIQPMIFIVTPHS